MAATKGLNEDTSRTPLFLYGDPQVVAWHDLWEAVGPFNHDDAVTLHGLFKTQLFDVVHVFKAVKVGVPQRDTTSLMQMYQAIGWAPYLATEL